ncbi:MAG: hypothetical protein HQK76_13820 [Desulfobacterales bacterium]|nr:hypothetical protein [Desulfobacterales bacterium]
MYVPNYQIHNVLKVYSKQIANARMGERKLQVNNASSKVNEVPRPPVLGDKVSITSGEKRQMIIDKIASKIVDRITKFGPQDDTDNEIVGKLQEELGAPVSFSKKKNSLAFVYQVIDEDNNKKINSVSLEESDFLINRLEELAKEAVNKNMEL